MTIDEAIRHCEEVAEQAGDCKCAEDHRQLAEWLRDYQKIKPERKKGKWIFDGDCYKCNKCGAVYSWWADSQVSNYCPNCGACMREGEQDG